MPVPMGIPICPITQDVMREPVIDKEGNTYEKSAILEWLKTNNKSPITRNVISASELIPNRALIQSNSTSNNNNSQENISKCSKCNKDLKISNYKGNKEPLCFNCRDWACKHCTFINKSCNKECEICENTR
jgi:hypothetical protein